MTTRRSSRARPRRGFTLVEMSMAALLLAMIMTLTVQILATAVVQRRSADRRQRALYEASNVLERVASLPLGRLTPDTLKNAKLSDATLLALPKADLKVSITDADHGLKRLVVEVRYSDKGDEVVGPVRLVTYLSDRGDRQ